MRILWLCNMMPGAIRESLGGAPGGGLWLDHVLAELRRQENLTLRVLCLWDTHQSGMLDDRTDYETYVEENPHRYTPQLEALYAEQLRNFMPDVIHIWGTEFGHTLAMVNAAQKLGMIRKVAISTQGLSGPCAKHYAEGIPEKVCRSYTFRDFVRMDNIAQQQKKFYQRAEMEQQALRQVHHIIGRTDWDRSCTHQMNPDAQYHTCNETMREAFYKDRWRYANCKKHRIFVNSFYFPFKGFHFMLQALAIVAKQYPDVEVGVTGYSFFDHSFSDWLHRESYFRYLAKLCRQLGLADKVTFYGTLSEADMKQAYLDANVYVLPSTVENSSNSLAEAMLLGMPCIAADVGGNSTLMHPGEGIFYPCPETDTLAQHIMDVFAMGERAEEMGAAAREHAFRTHDPEKNLQSLLEIYQEVAAQ